jgi:apolipoprotein N-acyltransferase
VKNWEVARPAIAVAAGCVSSLAYILGAGALPVVAGTALAVHCATLSRNAAGAAVVGWCYGACFYGISLDWVAAYSSLGRWVAVIYFSLYPALACILSRRQTRKDRITDWVWLCMVWGGLDFARSQLATGFPQITPGVSLAGTFAGAWIGPTFGQSGADVFVLASALALAPLLRARRWVTATSLLAAFATLTYLPPPQDTAAAKENGMRVLACQPSPAAQHRASDLQLRTAKNLRKHSGGGKPVVIWPECTLEAYSPSTIFLSEIDYLLRNGAEGVVCGVQVAAGEGRVETSLVAKDAVRQSRHIKTCLIPFGEFNPFPGAPWASRWINAARSCESIRGTQRQLLHCAGLNIVPVICYEDYFEECTREPLKHGNAHFIACIGNASDFAGTREGKIHVQHAAWRSLETGLWMVRSYSGGITCTISPQGRVQAIPQTEGGVIEVNIPKVPQTEKTAYVRWGYLLGPLCAWLFVGVLGYQCVVACGRSLTRK